jgi:acetyl-CoA carboxylase biotin carboxyl carrier protein
VPKVQHEPSTRDEEFVSPNGPLTDRSVEIQELVDLATRNNLSELEVVQEGLRIRIRREVGPVVTSMPAREFVPLRQETPEKAASTPVHAEAAGCVTVTSPIVGTFYRSASPDADPYVEEGDVVRKGQVLCIVEAMKLMNEIEAEVDGRIVKVLAESTKAVEYGQPLFLIDPKAMA